LTLARRESKYGSGRSASHDCCLEYFANEAHLIAVLIVVAEKGPPINVQSPLSVIAVAPPIISYLHKLARAVSSSTIPIPYPRVAEGRTVLDLKTAGRKRM